MATDEPNLIAIGEFARRTRLSPKALRIYDRIGLLRPRQIDEASGYRRYAPEQIPLARLVALLRGADLSLAAIQSVLSERSIDRERACLRLDSLLAEIERDHSGRRLVISHAKSILRDEGDPMFQIQVREVPARRLMSIQRRLYSTHTDAFVTEAKAVFAAHLNGRRPDGPFTLIFHGPVKEEADGPIEATLPVTADVEPTDLIGIRTEPAHAEAYTTITKRQWDYPAILAAYDAVACSPEVAGRSRSRLSCREVYLTEPDQIGDDDLICDIAFPLGDG